MSRRRKKNDEGEFLWLVSLSDLMILLFVFFVVLFSFSYKKMSAADLARMAAVLANQSVPRTPIDELQTKLKTVISDKNIAESVTVEREEDALVMNIRDKILFQSAEYVLSDGGKSLMSALSATLSKVPAPYRIGIEGHTDDVPIRTRTIADNWQLSSMRAHSILNSLAFQDDVLKRVVIMGYGEMKPIAPNRAPDGLPIPSNQQKNRRVTIRIY